MCPLRLVLVFFSAVLAGFIAWKSINYEPVSSPEPRKIEIRRCKSSVKGQKLGARRVIGNGFLVFLDMASGRHLWRTMKDDETSSRTR